MYKKPNKTKRKEQKKKNLKKLWDAFSDEGMDTSKKLELHYSKQTQEQREKCDLCDSVVAYMENKLFK